MNFRKRFWRGFYLYIPQGFSADTVISVGRQARAFGGADLLGVHTAYPHHPQPQNPSVSRMDSAQRCAVAFQRKSHAMRRNATMYFFSQDGVMRLTSAVRRAFPIGSSVPWVVPFLEALFSGHGGGASSCTAVAAPLTAFGARWAQKLQYPC